jgi:uncharacterized protein YfaS (alpha-2-macroglobulin family)
MTLYQAGETLRINAQITDSAGDPTDPTTVTISIKKPDGTLDVTDAAMSSDVAGTYYYDYAIASDTGLYYASVEATGSAGRVTIKPDSFSIGNAI